MLSLWYVFAFVFSLYICLLCNIHYLCDIEVVNVGEVLLREQQASYSLLHL